MPQTVWKGAISFGLVSIPVRLTAATEERDLSFHQVRASDGSRVRYRRVAEADGEEVAYKDIAKSYRTDAGVDVVLTDEDLAAVRISSSRTVELVGFVDAATIDPVSLTRAYFVEPAADDRKPYVLLRDALVETNRVAVVKLALRNRERLAVLRPRDEVLVLQTMLWPDEVRRVDVEVGSSAAVRPQELAMARSYIDALSGDVDLSDQHDGYREALLELVDAKAAGQSPPEAVEDEDTGGAAVVDLVEALRRSVAAATERRTPSASSPAAAHPATTGAPQGGRQSTAERRPAGADAKQQPSAARAAKKARAPRSETTAPAERAGTAGPKRPAKKAATPRRSRAAEPAVDDEPAKRPVRKSA